MSQLGLTTRSQTAGILLVSRLLKMLQPLCHGNRSVRRMRSSPPKLQAISQEVEIRPNNLQTRCPCFCHLVTRLRG
ncbi:hypothetical protein ASPBRDRAFT_407946 [Aspergillus brasiliensis CBS 101740]|uniref:Uncharacterized protein n=1 Tax=Aspergillus brasiliensis (strain CBS 101740 / IMI 381727 / IBT 21946) TaxID=767769 RepID=A0A1L9UXW6_ASPBC|nr:hypothetical protein ASPBRDRAFT_407946 [Aspergillus brasiliensis CBS 101740]